MALCRGNKRDGGSCGIWWGLNDLGYCFHHERQGLPRCQGVTHGRPCKKPAKSNYQFCCATHDPAVPYIPPRVLDALDFYLRPRVQDAVVARYDGNDIYNREPLNLITPRALDLDHIVEKQVFIFACFQLGLRQGDDDFGVATTTLRDCVVNELDNLGLTRPSANRIKGTAVFAYPDDYRTGHLQKTFTGYLRDAKRDGKSLGRDVTREITRNMGRSMKGCQRKLANEGETPVLERLSEELQQLNVAMNLRGAR